MRSTLSTLSIHTDDTLSTAPDVAPPLHVSTTFRYPDTPSALNPLSSTLAPDPLVHVYSRQSTQTLSRLECTLSAILHGHAVTYSSGLSAFHALLTHLTPKKVVMGDGYHGCQGVANLHARVSGCALRTLNNGLEGVGAGDLVHLETPVNPTGLAIDIKSLADRVHALGAVLSVDSTFAPPPLQDPFVFGADYVLHSATKYLGGHSDLLGGVIVVRSEREAQALKSDRTFLGCVMGSMEGWLELRSLRTLELRVERASLGAVRLAGWLNLLLPEHPVLAGVSHASLQREDWVRRQMPGGAGPVFAIYLRTEEMARTLPSRLKLFYHATSLGGVESLVEWRAMTDAGCDRRLIRVSVGVEWWEDLRGDLENGLREVGVITGAIEE